MSHLYIDAVTQTIIPDADITNNCIHCGLCLSSCPTYWLTLDEKSSPRGRIRLIKSILDGSLQITKESVAELDFCLGCRACESACPAGIKYGSILDAAKIFISRSKYRFDFSTLAIRFLLHHIFSSQSLLKKLARLFRVLQSKFFPLNKFHLNKDNKSGISLKRALNLMPRISDSFSSEILCERLSPSPAVKYRVIFMTGCIMDVAFSEVNYDTVQLLLKHGCEVIFPERQMCCGALQYHNGDFAGARKSAVHNVNLLLDHDADFIVANSAGCGAFLKEYAEIFKNEKALSKKAELFSRRVKDLTEFLINTDFPPVSLDENHRFYGKKISYHDACHLIHGQGVFDQPRKLIKAVSGIKFVELPEASWCCGSAGIYNITHFGDSMRILSRKIDRIKEISPDIIVSGNPGCLIQLRYGLQKEGLEVELLHTATFLRHAYAA